MRGTRVLIAAVVTSLLSAGCTNAPTAPATTKKSTTKAAKTSELKTSPEAQSFYGQVLGLDGKPASGVAVRAQLIANNGSGLVSNNGSGVISNNSSGVVANGGGNYRVLATGTLTATTDAQGRFSLVHPDGQPLNVEAVLDDTTKAIQLAVPASTQGLSLQLAPTGTIAGKVTAPKAPSVSDFEGVDVFIPGTSYSAKAAKDGSFTISNVPVGTFTLVATHQGLGRAEAAGVKVASKTTAQAADLALSAEDTTPAIASVSQPNGGPGVTVTIKGSNFGASKGTPFKVKFGGIEAMAPTRKDDATIECKVPDNGGSGGVVVEVGALSSAPAAFQVIKDLSLTPNKHNLVVNTTQQYTVEAKDSSGKPVANPAITWEAPDAAVSVSATGLVTAKAEGSGRVRAVAGAASSSNFMITVYASADDLPDAGSLVVEDSGLALGADGKVYASNDMSIHELDEAGAAGLYMGVENQDEPAPDAPFSWLTGIAVDAGGNFYVSDEGVIKKIGADKTVMTFAGAPGTTGLKDGLGGAARFNSPRRLTMAGNGTLYLLDDDNDGNGRIRKITASGAVTTLADTYGWETRLVASKTGTLYVANGQKIYTIDSAGAKAVFATLTASSDIEDPDFAAVVTAMAVDADGALWVISQGKLLKFAGDGTSTEVTPVAASGTLNQPVAMVFDKQGKLRVADSGEGKVLTLTLE